MLFNNSSSRQFQAHRTKRNNFTLDVLFIEEKILSEIVPSPTTTMFRIITARLKSHEQRRKDGNNDDEKLLDGH
jgi:hypothetical protein